MLNGLLPSTAPEQDAEAGITTVCLCQLSMSATVWSTWLMGSAIASVVQACNESHAYA